MKEKDKITYSTPKAQKSVFQLDLRYFRIYISFFMSKTEFLYVWKQQKPKSRTFKTDENWRFLPFQTDENRRFLRCEISENHASYV